MVAVNDNVGVVPAGLLPWVTVTLAWSAIENAPADMAQVARIVELAAEEELKAIRPEVDGREVMEHLGIAPGPLVGKALDFLLELRLDEGLVGREEVLRRLDEWWASQSVSS